MISAMPRVAIATADFDGVVGFFRDVLGVPVVDISGSSVQNLGAKLAMCVPTGGSNIELMCPADGKAPLSQSLEKFLGRRGEGLFALMLEAPDPDAEAERLLEQGLAVLPLMAGAGGRDLHPRSTHGVLIRIYPNGSFQSAADQVQLTASRTLGLSGIVRVIIAVRDLSRALDVYGRQLGLEIGKSEADVDRGVVAAMCQPPAGGVIELLSVMDQRKPFAASVAAHLSEKGEGLYALVLQSAEPAAVRTALIERGVEILDASDDLIAFSVAGTRVLIGT